MNPEYLMQLSMHFRHYPDLVKDVVALINANIITDTEARAIIGLTPEAEKAWVKRKADSENHFKQSLS